MPVGGFTVGRDIALDIVTAAGILRPNKVTKFSSKPDINKQKVTGLDGRTKNLLIPEGWSGEIEIERANSALDDWWATWEANYYAGIDNGYATITETITEQSGVTVYRYIKVQLQLEDAGEKSGTSTVKQKLSWTAEQRKKVA